MTTNALMTMDAPTLERDAVLARYRHLRAISGRHNDAALRHLPRDAIVEAARALGLVFGRTVVADSEDTLAVAADLAVHAPRQARSRAIDRYRKAAAFPEGSDEARVLHAMCAAQFSLWAIERRHPVAGVIVRDLMRRAEAWLMDLGLERTAQNGLILATRLFQPDAFAMTCGAAVPVDHDIVEDAVYGAYRRPPAPDGALAGDPKFAAAIYRAAIEHGVMEHTRFE